MPPSSSLKLGIPVSLSGQFQVQGRQALAGVQAWAEDVNRSGGISLRQGGPRRPVAVVHHDDGSEPDRVRRVARQLITRDRVDVLLGPYSSVLSLAAAEVAEGYEKLMWNQGGAADGIYQRGYRWVVGTLTPASEYLAGLLPLVRQADPAAKTLGIVRACPGEFPREVSQPLAWTYKALGFRLSLVREYPPSTIDFRNILEEVRGIRPDVLVAVGRIRNDLELARCLARRRPSLRAVAVVAAPIQQFREALGEESEGFLGPSQWEETCRYSTGYGPASGEVLASLRRHGPEQVDYPMVQAYAACLVLQRCLETAGTVEDRALRAAAGILDFSTFFGRFKIDPDTGKQIGHAAVLVQWQQGRRVIVWPPEQREGRLSYPWPGRGPG
jgi:branched-chain amino acid transport system substrate-binding protein